MARPGGRATSRRGRPATAASSRHLLDQQHDQQDQHDEQEGEDHPGERMAVVMALEDHLRVPAAIRESRPHALIVRSLRWYDEVS